MADRGSSDDLARHLGDKPGCRDETLDIDTAAVLLEMVDVLGERLVGADETEREPVSEQLC